MITATVTGDKRLDRRLANLGKRGATRAITAGVRAGLTPVARALRRAINASSVSTQVKREARKTVGKRFKRKRGSKIREAKVGFAVGKKVKKESGKKGVGISSNNIHWFVLGTEQRSTKNGRDTGQIEDMFSGLCQQALDRSKQAAMDAARAKISQVIKREAKKQA